MTAAQKRPRKRVTVPGLTEAQLQRSVADQFKELLEPPVLWNAIQPEGRGPIEGARMKKRGVQAGWPDFLILAPGPRVVGIELKVGRNKQSAEQLAFAGWFPQCHGQYFICRSTDDVIEALDRARIPHRMVHIVGGNWGRRGL